MKYSEFKQRVIDIGFTVEDEDREVWVVDDEGVIVATVSTDITNSMDTDYITFKEQGEDVRREILDLTYKLSKTPLTEREEEKKYHLKLELPIPLEDSSMHWLNQKVGASKYHFGSQENIRDYKTIFTESEVAQMDLTGLKLIEVKDE